jgi:hypothetical protein
VSSTFLANSGVSPGLKYNLICHNGDIYWIITKFCLEGFLRYDAINLDANVKLLQLVLILFQVLIRGDNFIVNIKINTYTGCI